MKRVFLLEMEVDWGDEVLEDLHPELVLEDALVIQYPKTKIKVVAEIPIGKGGYIAKIINK